MPQIDVDWKPRAKDLEDLSRRSQKLVTEAHRRFRFNVPGGKLVVSVARTLDRMDELNAEVRGEGATVPGSRGRQKVNPKVRELRRLERRVAMVLRHFELEDLR